MPSAIAISPVEDSNGITKLTNCRLLRGDRLVEGDIWISSATGKIMRSQAAFYDNKTSPDRIIDLGGRIVSPGLIDCQLNGAYGFNFSTLFDDMSQYAKNLRDVNKRLLETGVTSYLPTLTSQKRELYHQVLPFLAPSRPINNAQYEAESLGAHVEGPFLSPTKNGVHNADVFREAHDWTDIEDMYGAANLRPIVDDGPQRPASIKMVTAAPEVGRMTELIPELTSRGIIFAMGHSEATYEDATAALHHGATMITHLFNAMRPLHHRNPGIFGVLGEAEPAGPHNARESRNRDSGVSVTMPRPWFGVIADGIHLHPTSVKIAFNAHPDGFILVTDAMHMLGCPDGLFPWTNGNGKVNLVKEGNTLLLENSNTLAGSTITLIECVTNFLNWSGCTVAQALRSVTSTPAVMLGLGGVKGTLDAGADADLVVLSEEEDNATGVRKLVVDEVWKFGTRVC